LQRFKCGRDWFAGMTVHDGDHVLDIPATVHELAREPVEHLLTGDSCMPKLSRTFGWLVPKTVSEAVHKDAAVSGSRETSHWPSAGWAADLRPPR
jgi:hypothetical protein